MGQPRGKYRSEKVRLEEFREMLLTVVQGLIAEGRYLPASVLRERRNFTAEQLELAESEGRIFAVESPDGEAYYPEFFCDPNLTERVELVTQELKGLAGWDKWVFFIQPRGRLGGETPIEALAHGKLELVLQEAKGRGGAHGVSHHSFRS